MKNINFFIFKTSIFIYSFHQLVFFKVFFLNLRKNNKVIKKRNDSGRIFFKKQVDSLLKFMTYKYSIFLIINLHKLLIGTYIRIFVIYFHSISIMIECITNYIFPQKICLNMSIEIFDERY